MLSKEVDQWLRDEAEYSSFFWFPLALVDPTWSVNMFLEAAHVELFC